MARHLLEDKGKLDDLMTPTCRDNTRLHDVRLMVPQEEGIILKSPQSQWTPDNRSLGAWMKLKPEYTKAYEVKMQAARLDD